VADEACLVRRFSDVNVGLVIKILRQWTLEGYDLNVIDVSCSKNTLN
jgi:hypothetical protein